MEGGMGPRSYARNSAINRSIFHVAKESISSAIAACDLSLFEKDMLCITDMGCSSGPNTVNAVEFVMDAISQKLKHGSKIPKFQVFFSDLRATDFNTLFELLPEKQGQPYFYAAAPGSFYDRLLPDCSVHFGMCSLGLHILSKVPPVVNDGKLFVDTPNTQAYEQFKAQAQDDLRMFLNHRLQEIVPGGLLVLLIPRGFASPLKAMELAWKELIHEGLVNQQTLDSYNVPCWPFRDAEAMEKEVMEVKGFKIVHLAHINYKTGTTTPSAFVGTIRASSWQSIVQHLGSENLADELFKRFEARIMPDEEGNLTTIPLLLAILKKEGML